MRVRKGIRNCVHVSVFAFSWQKYAHKKKRKRVQSMILSLTLFVYLPILERLFRTARQHTHSALFYERARCEREQVFHKKKICANVCAMQYALERILQYFFLCSFLFFEMSLSYYFFSVFILLLRGRLFSLFYAVFSLSLCVCVFVCECCIVCHQF